MKARPRIRRASRRVARTAAWAAALLLPGLLALPPRPAMAGSAVVLRSDDAAVKPGQLLDEHSTLSLPAAGAITLITPEGGMMMLEGPYHARPLAGSGKTDPAGMVLLARLANLIGANDISGAAPHATPAGPPEPTDPFAIDIAAPGVYCVPPDLPPSLWRAASTAALTARLSRALGGQSATILWPAGVASIPWPTGLPIESDENYLLQPDGAAAPVTLLLRRMPAGLPTDAHRAIWLAGHGCRAQGRRLLGLP